MFVCIVVALGASLGVSLSPFAYSLPVGSGTAVDLQQSSGSVVDAKAEVAATVVVLQFTSAAPKRLIFCAELASYMILLSLR